MASKRDIKWTRLKEVEIDREHEKFIRELFKNTSADIFASKEDHGAFLLSAWVRAMIPKQLIVCNLVWRELLEFFNRHTDLVKIDLMVIGDFSVKEEEDENQGEEEREKENRLLNFESDPYFVTHVGLPITINDESKFHLPWDDELTYKRYQLKAMGYVKKGEVWIPCSRILEIKFTLY